MAQPIPFGEWTPDLGRMAGAVDVVGCVSLNKRYAPLQSPAPIGSIATINDPCLGGLSCYQSTGEHAAFVGDRGRLYRLTANSPVDVSRAGGYSADPEWAWSFCQFGDNIIAVSRGVAPQVYQLGSATAFTDLGGSAPWGDCVFRIRQQVFICGGRTVNVSAFNNSSSWTPDAATQAYINTVGQDAGLIVAGIGGEQGAIFQERGIVRVTYTGSSVAPHNYDEVEGGRGAVSPHAVTPWGRGAFCVAEDGFYFYDGMQAQPIGADKVDRYFAERLSYAYRSRVWAAIDAKRKCWMVGYPAAGASTCNEVLIYSWADQRWTHDMLPSQFGFELHRDGVSADDSAAITRLLGTDVADGPEAAAVSVDSAMWRESRREWALVDGTRTICGFTGPSRQATMSTAVMEPNAGRKTFVDAVWPITDADPSMVTATVSTRLRRLDETPVDEGPAQMQDEGMCELRAEGRFLSGSVTIAAGADWSEASGLTVDGGVSGGR